MLKFTEIFVPGGFPPHTYNPRGSLGLEAKLGEVKDNLCKLVTVTGHTKSGKTVLVRKVLPQTESVWIDGGAGTREEDVWDLIAEQIGAYSDIETEESHERTSEIEARGSAEANFIIAKGQGEIAGTQGRTTGSAVRRARAVSAKVATLNRLRNTKAPLVIDDFHYLPKDVQGNVIRALKPLIFDGLPVVIIAIPHRRYDAVKVEREMAGRISPITVPPWSPDELSFIPSTGFKLLGYRIDEKDCARFAENAIGSPHLMQDFCRTACRLNDLPAALPPGPLEFGPERSEGFFREVAETIGRPIFEKLARGPRQRSDRKERELKDGREVDIYELVLHALASLRPGLVSLEYEDLRAAIRNVAGSAIPQLHEVARVLKHMATIASSDQTSTPVIDFEEDEKKLHITDPFFAFYLRWGDLHD
jgi:hypothetical protein